MTQPDEQPGRTPPGPSPLEAQMAAPPPPTEPVVATLVNAPAAESNHSELMQSKAVVLAMLFLVTGALGIPLLWANRRFSNAERIFWSILATLYTILLIAVVYAVLVWSYRQVFP